MAKPTPTVNVLNPQTRDLVTHHAPRLQPTYGTIWLVFRCNASLASSGDYASRWYMMPRADDIIIEKVSPHTQTVYIHAIMSRTTVAGECLLNIDQHTAKLNIYHNASNNIQHSWIAQPTYKQDCDCFVETGVVAWQKNNRRSRLLNTLMNSLNESIKANNRKLTPKINSNLPRPLRIRITVT